MLEIVGYLFVGICSGLLSGLFGIGGGIIVVPALVLILQHHPDFQSADTMLIAASTSLIIMALTSASSANAYRRRQSLVWSLFVNILPGLCIGLASGTWLSHRLGNHLVTNLFAIFLIGIAIHLWVAARRSASSSKPSEQITQYQDFTAKQRILLWGGGFVVGNLSTLFGIGGGVLLVPLFLMLRCTMHQASGTSALCGMVSALVGSIFLAYLPQPIHALPDMIGNIYWPATAGIGIASVLCAPLGTRIAFYLRSSLLKQIFAGILIISAGSLLQI